jgi:predicted nucleic acid-binding protein
MIVITDTTALRYLAVLGELEILPRLFGEIVCPLEVLAECGHASAPEVLRSWGADPPDWLKPGKAGHPDERVSDLGSGEAAAIMLALERRTDLLVIDWKWDTHDSPWPNSGNAWVFETLTG